MWPYVNIIREDYEKSLKMVERIIEKLGAVCVGEQKEKATQVSNMR